MCRRPGPQDAASFFAATPLLEPLRFVWSRAMTEVREDRGREVVITFLEMSWAHLHSPVRRKVFARACGDDTECPRGPCWKLLKAMYGLREASAVFDKKVETVIENLGHRVGLFNPRLCHSESERAAVFPYGDDFVAFSGHAVKR